MEETSHPTAGNIKGTREDLTGHRNIYPLALRSKHAQFGRRGDEPSRRLPCSAISNARKAKGLAIPGVFREHPVRYRQAAAVKIQVSSEVLSSKSVEKKAHEHCSYYYWNERTK